MPPRPRHPLPHDRTAQVREVFGRLLAVLRKQLDMTGEQLAHKASLSVTALRNLETGVSSPSLEQQRRLAEALGLTTQELLSKFELVVRFLEGRRTWVFEVHPNQVKDGGRLKAQPRDEAIFEGAPLLVTGRTLVLEVQAALVGNHALPRTPQEAAQQFLDGLTPSPKSPIAGLAVEPTQDLDEDAASAQIYRPGDGSPIGQSLQILNDLLASTHAAQSRIAVMFDPAAVPRATVHRSAAPGPNASGDLVVLAPPSSKAALGPQVVETFARLLTSPAEESR